MNPQVFKAMALSFNNITGQPHFEKISFRFHKKIVATLDQHHAVLKLSDVDQSVFCAYNKSLVYPATGKWGLQGWTVFEIANLPDTLVVDAFATAYQRAKTRK